MLLSFATSTCRFRSPLTFAFIITRDSSAHYYNVAHCVRSLFSSAASVSYFRSPFPFIILARHFCLIPSHATVARYYCGTSFSLPIFVRRFHSQVLFATLSSYSRSFQSHSIFAHYFRTLLALAIFTIRPQTNPKCTPKEPTNGADLALNW